MTGSGSVSNGEKMVAGEEGGELDIDNRRRISTAAMCVLARGSKVARASLSRPSREIFAVFDAVSRCDCASAILVPRRSSTFFSLSICSSFLSGLSLCRCARRRACRPNVSSSDAPLAGSSEQGTLRSRLIGEIGWRATRGLLSVRCIGETTRRDFAQVTSSCALTIMLHRLSLFHMRMTFNPPAAAWCILHLRLLLLFCFSFVDFT